MIVQSKINLTDEQKQIIDEVFCNPVVMVNALAGTGKTTTCFSVMSEFIKCNKTNILYLVYNTAMKEEAEKRAKQLGIDSYIDIKTVHAFAYKYMAITGYFKNKKQQSLRVKDIANYFNCHYSVAYGIMKLFQYFLVTDYSVSESGVKEFFENLDSYYVINFVEPYKIYPYHLINLIDGIEEGYLSCPHDFYLKKFIDLVANGKIYCKKYDLIILDESQDANPVFISLIKNLNTKHLLLVGDRHQWIYAFRGSVNLMEQFDNVKKLYLTHTFRFDTSISDMANIILKFKGEKYLIKSKKMSTVPKKLAYIGRTNSVVLENYINLNSNEKKHVCFERGIEEIIKLPLTISAINECLSLSEVESILKSKKISVSAVIDKSLYYNFKSVSDFYEYLYVINNSRVRDAENALKHKATYEDPLLIESDILCACNLARMFNFKFFVDLISEHRKTKKEKKEIYFSTAHSSKGQEYQIVNVFNDFVIDVPSTSNNFDNLVSDINKVIRFLHSNKISEKDKLKLIDIICKRNLQELNLLYVTLTRPADQVKLSQSVEKILEFLNVCNNIKESLSVN